MRRAGFKTDLADFTDVARCRMYRSWHEVCSGFAKNAHEGLGSPGGIVPWTVLLLGGQTAWLLLLPFALAACRRCRVALAAGLSLGARALLAAAIRAAAGRRVLHPLAVARLVAIQWWALARRLRGRPVAWKRRTVSEATSAQRVAPATSGGVSQSAAR